MKSKWILSLAAGLGLLVAVVSLAADSARTPAPEVQKKVVRIELDGDEAGGEWLWDGEVDDLGLFALGDGEWESGGDEDRRIVIRRRSGGMGEGGPGMRWTRKGHGGGAGMGHGMGMGRGMGMHRGMAGAFARLELTDAQKAKMADLHERQQRRAIQARADMQLARMDLHKLMKADSPNAPAINAQIDKMSKMRADMQKGHVGTFLEARAMLTPEQQKQLREGAMGEPGRRMLMHRKMTGGAEKSD